jgi:hypothetical protein
VKNTTHKEARKAKRERKEESGNENKLKKKEIMKATKELNRAREQARNEKRR